MISVAVLVTVTGVVAAVAASTGAADGSPGEVSTEVLGVVVDRPTDEPDVVDELGDGSPAITTSTTVLAAETDATTTSAPPPTPTTAATPPPTTTTATPSTRPPSDLAPPPVPAPPVDLSFLVPATETTISVPETVPVESTPPPVETTMPATSVPPSSANETMGAEAERLIAYPFRQMLSGWTIRYLSGRGGVRGLTFPDSNTIEIYVRAGDTASVVARVLAHELGHAVDVSLNSEADRQRWREARGAGPEVAWWPTSTTFDFDTLAGDFAEAFAVWQVAADSRSNVGGSLTADQLAIIAELAQG